MLEVALVAVGRRDALVDLHDVDLLPGDILVGQCPQHLPGRAAAAHRHHELATLRNGLPGQSGDPPSGVLSHGSGIVKYFSLHRGITCRKLFEIAWDYYKGELRHNQPQHRSKCRGGGEST